ncbi:pentapeptide repeat-containing protein [Streptomyces sp. NPDC048479]|uniref:pentapeptide repeat-containing protein n=1 Tax=Streptomyces sp. NPDC048479 TaxID=3154725 RepID=UPI00343017DE
MTISISHTGRRWLLAAVVDKIDRASADFCGADLRSVDLDGVDLEGVRWDSTSVWPSKWHNRIWRALLAAETGMGVLVVGVESHDSSVPADI